MFAAAALASLWVPALAVAEGTQPSQLSFSVDNNVPSGMVGAEVHASSQGPPYNQPIGGTINVHDSTRSYGTFPAYKDPTTPIERHSIGPVAAGRQTFTASYSGDDTYAASSAQWTFNVFARSVTTHLGSDPRHAVIVGTEVTFYASVWMDEPGSAPPLPDMPPSTVTFMDNGAEVHRSPTSEGRGEWTSALPLGQHRVTARYDGDPFYAASNPSNSVELWVATDPDGSSTTPTTEKARDRGAGQDTPATTDSSAGEDIESSPAAESSVGVDVPSSSKADVPSAEDTDAAVTTRTSGDVGVGRTAGEAADAAVDRWPSSDAASGADHSAEYESQAITSSGSDDADSRGLPWPIVVVFLVGGAATLVVRVKSSIRGRNQADIE